MSEQSTDLWWPVSQLDRKRYSSVAGPVVGRIASAQERGRLPHAVMLVGPAGLGRELAAVEAAALLVCNESPPVVGCDCSCCTRVLSGIHPDVAALMPQGASQQIRIDQIRQVVEAAPGRPFEGRHRVWILDGVEAGRFGAEAANAFLKTLEEPPEHVRFLLLAANPEAVLPTIRSRCQQLALAGAVAVAHHLGGLLVPPELAAAALTGDDVAATVGSTAAALTGALAGEVLDLIRLARQLAAEPQAFDLLATAALQVMGGAEHHAESLVRLANQALVSGRQTRALNLNRERQLLACLLRWYRE